MSEKMTFDNDKHPLPDETKIVKAFADAAGIVVLIEKIQAVGVEIETGESVVQDFWNINAAIGRIPDRVATTDYSSLKSDLRLELAQIYAPYLFRSAKNEMSSTSDNSDSVLPLNKSERSVKELERMFETLGIKQQVKLDIGQGPNYLSNLINDAPDRQGDVYFGALKIRAQKLLQEALPALTRAQDLNEGMGISASENPDTTLPSDADIKYLVERAPTEEDMRLAERGDVGTSLIVYQPGGDKIQKTKDLCAGLIEIDNDQTSALGEDQISGFLTPEYQALIDEIKASGGKVEFHKVDLKDKSFENSDEKIQYVIENAIKYGIYSIPDVFDGACDFRKKLLEREFLKIAVPPESSISGEAIDSNPAAPSAGKLISGKSDQSSALVPPEYQAIIPELQALIDKIEASGGVVEFHKVDSKDIAFDSNDEKNRFVILKAIEDAIDALDASLQEPFLEEFFRILAWPLQGPISGKAEDSNPVSPALRKMYNKGMQEGLREGFESGKNVGRDEAIAEQAERIKAAIDDAYNRGFAAGRGRAEQQNCSGQPFHGSEIGDLFNTSQLQFQRVFSAPVTARFAPTPYRGALLPK